MDYFEARDRVRSRYGHHLDPREVALATTEPLGDKGFLTEIAGKVILTAPSSTFNSPDELPRELAVRWRETAAESNHPYYTWLQARYVEAERANLNGAFWSTSDLQFGEPSVKYGPLNWLHNEKQVVGTLVDGALIQPGREFARKYTQDQREEMAKKGEALPDGSYPIHDKVDLKDAIEAIGRARDPGEAKAHIEKRAKELDALNLLPTDWKEKAALLDQRDRPYLATVATVWDWVHPDKAAAIQRFNEAGSLWVSMECTGKQIACVSDGARVGCDQSFDYVQAMTNPQSTCGHLADRSSARRIVEPTFLGAGIIVPPERPAWADASAEIMRATAALAESAHSNAVDMPDEAWLALVAQVLTTASA